MQENSMPREILPPSGGKELEGSEFENPTKGLKIDLKDAVYYMLVVLFVGFIAIIITVLIYIGGSLESNLSLKQATYQSLVNQITAQNAKIDMLTTIDTQILLKTK